MKTVFVKLSIIRTALGLLVLYSSFMHAQSVEVPWQRAMWIAMEPVDTIVTYGFHGEGEARRYLGDKRIGMYRMPMFRKVFDVESKVVSAKAWVCGLGHFDFYLNGRKVGDHFLDAGWTKYDKEVEYVEFDVTAMLRKGKNVAGVMLGNGFYNVPRERYFKLTNSFGNPKLRFLMRIHYADGRDVWLASDTNWTCVPSPITFSSIYGGEDYDARLEQAGWNESAAFDDSHWQRSIPATIDGKPYEIKMKPQRGTALKERQLLQPIRHWQNSSGKWIYDFGQNFAGFVRYDVSGGDTGAEILLTPSELLREDDKPNLSMGSPVYWKYVNARPETRKSVQPRFHYYGFRYIEMEGGVPEGEANPDNLPVLANVTGVHISNEMEEVGTFHCSNELFNRIHDLIDWAIRSNMASIITDCPHREKLGWLEQAHLMQHSMMYRYDLRALYHKLMSDMKASQWDNGCIPTIAPEYVRFASGFEDTPEWGSAFILCPWYYYQWYGDDSLVRTYYDDMKRYIDYLTSRAEHHIIDYGLGDWYDIGPNPPGYAQLTPVALSATAIYYYDICTMQQIADILGKTSDAQAFADLALQVKSAFGNRFPGIDGGIPTHANGQESGLAEAQTMSQTALSMALVTGLTNNHDGTLAQLIADIERRNYALTAGDVGYSFLVRALSDAGRADILYKMNSKEDAPGYAWQLQHGATSLTESWQAYDNVSNNHLMLGHLMQWFYSQVGGIRMQDGTIGWRHILIDPHPVGNVTSASTTFRSPRGMITTDWKVKNGKCTVTFSIPDGCDAVVAIPQADGTKEYRQYKNGKHKCKWNVAN